MTPKAELHVHLEGTAPPELVRRLAKRNRLDLPDELFGDDGEYHWTDFLHFLKVYDATAAVIRTPEDYRDVTYEYLAGCAEEGAIYVEVMSSPDHAAAAGLSYANHLEGIVAGIEDASADHAIEGRCIVTCVRHFGTEQAMKVARQVTSHPHPLVSGFGMGGDEAGFPPAQFARAFTYVADSGLPCTVHAGEWAGADRVREAGYKPSRLRTTLILRSRLLPGHKFYVRIPRALCVGTDGNSLRGTRGSQPLERVERPTR